MLEYFTIKKFRKNHRSTPSADSATTPKEPLTPLLAPHDERFLARVIEGNTEPESVIFSGPQPPQAPVKTTTESVPKTASPATTGDGDWKGSLRDKWGYLEALGSSTASRVGQAVVGKGKDKDKGKDKGKGKEKATEVPADGVGSTATAPTGPPDIIREDQELTEILERLNCAVSNGTVFSSPSGAIKPLIGKFTQVFKDLINGVPTAYDDLISLFDSSASLMEKTYSSLPNFIKQIIQTIPDKMTPAVLRTLAATSPATASVAGKLGLKEMVTTPGLLVELLKSIAQVLKTRFPSLLGGGVAVGLAVFILFFVLWYCYKRGKETREEREEGERMEVFGVERIETKKELEKKKKEGNTVTAGPAN